MKNSRKSQIAVIIGLTITIILSYVLFMGGKRGLPLMKFYILSYILFIIAVGIIMYYIAMSKNKIISITISVVAIIIDLLVLARYVTYHTCLFVPFYIIYWTYKTAQRVDKMAAAKGISSDMATLCLILAIFVPIIPPILLQDKMNNIATANDTQYVSTPKGEKVNGATLGTAEELKNFKELLDSGVITQEEFDEKKKQLLGL